MEPQHAIIGSKSATDRRTKISIGLENGVANEVARGRREREREIEQEGDRKRRIHPRPDVDLVDNMKTDKKSRGGDAEEEGGAGGVVTARIDKLWKSHA